MASTEIGLIKGAAVLAAMYMAGNVLWRLYEPKLATPDPNVLAQIQRGRQVADVCASCHYLDQHANFVGPNLVGILGRPIADANGYAYSSAIRDLKGEWTADRLVAFLTNPQYFAPGTKMAVTGWSPDDAQAVLAYFKSKE